MLARRGHGGVDHRWHVHEHAGPLEHLAAGHQAVAAVDLGERGGDDRGAAQRVVGVDAVAEGGQAGERVDDGVDLRFVALVVGGVAPPLDQGPRRGGRVAQPGEEGVVRVARRHDDARGHLGAVVELHAAHRLALARDGRDFGVQAHRAAGGLEGQAERLGHLTAAADGAAEGAHMAQGVGERAETGAGHLGRDAPHHRTRHHGRAAQRIGGEELAHDVGGAAPAPAQQGADALAAAGQHGAGETAERGRLAGCLEHQLHRRGGSLQVAAIPVDLTGVGVGERVEGAVEVFVQRPRRAAVPRHVHLCRLDVEVAQAVIGEAQFFDDRGGSEGDVVAVADVHRAATERLAGSRAAHRAAGLDQQRAQTGAGEIGGTDQAVVACPHHDGVDIVAVHP